MDIRTLRALIRETARSTLISEGMSYHVNNARPLTENVYRPGSSEFFALFREAREMWRVGEYFPLNEAEAELLDSDIGEFGMYEGRMVPLDFPRVDEAKYKGREVKLGATGAKRSGGRAHVYVKNDKGNVVKVSFGSGAPDAMGDSEAHRKRRKNFGDRHDCANKKDKTKPGYWSCRATKLFGRKISGWW